jgi:hypothetical protein
MEKTKFEQKQASNFSAPKLADNGGGGLPPGGKDLGGGGGGDDDDDDEWGFGDGEEGDEGKEWWRKPMTENFDRKFVDAVLQEFGRSFMDLPIILRKGVEMGLISTAMMWRFMLSDIRPSVARSIYEANIPVFLQKGLIGRLVADPAFLQKMAVDTAVACGINMYWEVNQRGPRWKEEMDQVAISTLFLGMANCALIYRLAPMRANMGVADGAAPWQKILGAVPNNIAAPAWKMENYTTLQRLSSPVVKAAELAMIGALAGAATTTAQTASSALMGRKNATSMPVPDVGTAAAATGAFMASSSNLRYQAIFAFDRIFFDRSKVLAPFLLLTTGIRAASSWAGQASKNWFLGNPHELPAKYRVKDGKLYQHAGGYKYRLVKPKSSRGVGVGVGGGASANGTRRVVKRRVVKRGSPSGEGNGVASTSSSSSVSTTAAAPSASTPVTA